LPVPEPLEPVTLVGRHVALEPLSIEHVDSLLPAATRDRRTFDFTWVPATADEMRSYIDTLLADHDRGTALPFAQRRVDTGELVGCTRFLDVRWWGAKAGPAEVEIGGTWLATDAQRTAINTEAKLLLLAHAFDTLGVWRVAICTDDRNARSRVAILRIGATFEGILRNHRPRHNTTPPAPRDSAMYSIIDGEWPDVRTGLEARLAGGR
jgi:RimJ/RimL family protein N-acetyltransferase